MNTPSRSRGPGFIGYLASLLADGQIAVRHLPRRRARHPRSGPGRAPQVECQMMLAAMVLIIFNVFFWTLFEQAASSLTLFADRNTDRSCSDFHLSAPPDAEFQPDLDRAVRAGAELAVDRPRQARARTVDPDQVRTRADAASASASCSWSADRPAGRQRASQVGLWWLAPAYFLPLDCGALHLAGRPQHDHQAVDRAGCGHDDGRVVPVDLGRAIFRGAAAQLRRRCRRSAGRSPTQACSLTTYTHTFIDRVNRDRRGRRSAADLAMAAQEVDARGEVAAGRPRLNGRHDTQILRHRRHSRAHQQRADDGRRWRCASAWRRARISFAATTGTGS